MTTGPGAEARAALSKAEYEWWRKDDVSPAASAADRAHTDDGGQVDEELFKQFYVVDASLGRLTVVLRQYWRRWYFFLGRSRDYRRLLAWHAGIHLAWITWFVAVHAATRVEVSDGVRRLKVSPDDRLFGVWGRVHDALRLIGGHRTERHAAKTEDGARAKKEAAAHSNAGVKTGPGRKIVTDETTVRGFATAELQFWIDKAQENRPRRNAKAIAALAYLAKEDLGLDITIPDLVFRAFAEPVCTVDVG
ncbi:hypothetical protein WKY82_08285 [Gordonia malaquae]|uniref:hypothetical protein n=1 Tax=Gordonia malaquae TaxID=410332 RepID=UPI0030C7A0EC